MNRAERLYAFFAGFGIPAYEASAVPSGDDAPDFPYLTYGLVLGSFGETVSMTVSIWYRSSSWVPALVKSEELYKAIGRSGIILPCDEGGILIQRGRPFAQTMGDPEDDMIRRVYVNISVEYITA